jgi:hypothetical protein
MLSTFRYTILTFTQLRLIQLKFFENLRSQYLKKKSHSNGLFYCFDCQNKHNILINTYSLFFPYDMFRPCVPAIIRQVLL